LQFRKGQAVINKLKRLKYPDKIQKSPNPHQLWPDTRGTWGDMYHLNQMNEKTRIPQKNLELFAIQKGPNGN
jgi:hypothetical protein